MQVTETLADGLRREYKVVVPAADIKNEIEDRLVSLSKSVEIKGFRRGKVPVSLVRQRYAASVLRDVLKATVAESSERLMQEKGVRPVLQPKIEVTQFAEGSDLEYKMALEVLPEVELGDFGRLEFTRFKVEVTDEEIEGALRRMAERAKRFSPVASGRPSRTGDLLVIDYAGSVEGKPLEDGKADGFEIELGSGALMPGFEEQLTGAKSGDHRTVEIDFPRDYPAENLAGKPATFEVDVNEVQEREPVEVNEDFAKDRGFENLEKLKEALRAELQSEYGALARNRLKRELFDRLSEAYDFDLPPSMVTHEFDLVWSRLKAEMERDKTSFEDMGESEEALREDYRRLTDRRVRLGLLLSEVGRRHGITVERSELLKVAAARMLQQYPGQQRQVLEYFRKNPEALDEFHPQLFEDKVVDFILEIAKVSEQRVSSEEFAKLSEAQAEAEGAKKNKGKARLKAKPKAQAKSDKVKPAKPKAAPKAKRKKSRA